MKYGIDEDESHDDNREISEELSIVVSDDDIACAWSLNVEQKYAYDQILDRVFSKYLFCFLFPGGSWKVLITLTTASSKVTPSLSHGQRTTHSRFKIPLVLEEYNTCYISRQSWLTKLMKCTSLIVWDEAPMAKMKQLNH